MDSVTQTSDLSQALAAATNYALPLNADGGNAAAQLFANLLSQNYAPDLSSDLTPEIAASITSSKMASSSNLSAPPSAPPPDATPPLPVLQNLVTDLHTLLQKMKSEQQNNNNSQVSNSSTKGASADPSQDSATAASTQSSQNNKTSSFYSTPSNSQDQTASSSATSTTNTTTDATNASQPSIYDILSQLQLMLRALEQKMQLAGSTGTSADASQTTSASNASDASSADGADATTQGGLSLAQTLDSLLALTQMISKQLNASQALDPSTAGGQTAALVTASQTLAANSNDQATGDLKTLLDDLRNYIASNGGQDATDLATSAATSASTNSSIGAPGSLTFDAPKTSLASQNDFLSLFSSQPSTNANFTPLNATATSTAIAMSSEGGKEGTSSFDMDMGSQGQGGTASQGATNSNANSAGLTSLADNAKASNPYSFASQLSATRATALGSTGLPNAVEQVILQLNRNVKTGNDQMTLQLNPADLGRVNIKLTFDGEGKVQGTVVADNPATLHLLSKDVGSLERALQEAGLRADPGSLQFSLGGQSGNSGQTSDNPSKSGGNASSSNAADTATNVSTDQSETWYVTPGRVNFKV